MSGNFSSIQFDEISADQAKTARILTENLDATIRAITPEGSRYTSLALTSLEEMFMWVGKAIREAQIGRENAANGEVKAEG